ncbi:MAG: putative DNA-binding protein [Hyphomicrobiales bacterium]|jgi:hypothetical protein|nr:putative DNA-binding protein [Hyphomicrobiales bacterium]
MTKTEDRDEVWADFREAVNMTPAALEKWLKTEDSRDVGWVAEGKTESVGHHSGRRIVEILRSRRADLDADDFAHMKKVVGYVHRHLAQRPDGDISETRWRYSLMNWGHDPKKD